jgi:flagellar L-ring protein precursor FlgH|tara:strand:- start:23 stop:655 length:633 start_codon:yes stop_codon:yes gene_type:complete
MAKNTLTMKVSILTILGFLFLTNDMFAQFSLYSDVKAKRVGDIITVVLRENLQGSSTTDSKVTSNSNGQATGSLSGNFLPFEPVFGSGVSVNYGSDQKNLATQRQLLEGYVSVQIVEVTEQGDLIVEGKRQTEVNGEVHEMSIAGTVRVNDIDGRNQVLSYRIANAAISYQKMGGIKDKKGSRGILKKVVFGGLGAGLAAAAILRTNSKN